jgi:hypothetical protein
LTRIHQVKLRIEGQQMASSDVRSANSTTVDLSFITFDPRTSSVDIESVHKVREELIKSIHEGVCA